MAKDQTRRLKNKQVRENENCLYALQSITGYSPNSAGYSVASGQTLQTDMHTKQAAEAQAKANYQAAKDNATMAEWAMHNYVLGTKDQVRAQFGADSNELQSLGLKKKTEYKRRSRKKTTD